MSNTSRTFKNKLTESVDFMAFDDENHDERFTTVPGVDPNASSTSSPGAGSNELDYEETKYIAIKCSQGLNIAIETLEGNSAEMIQMHTDHPNYTSGNHTILVFRTIYNSSGGGNSGDIEIIDPAPIFP